MPQKRRPGALRDDCIYRLACVWVMGDQRRDDGTTRRRRQASTLSASFPRRAGAYLLGPRLNSVSTSPVRSIVQHLAKKEGTDEFYTMKILELEPPPPVQTTQDDRQGRMLVHTEYSLLSLLAAQEGVIHCHDLFVDKYGGGGGGGGGGGERARLCLVLDCVTPHDFARDTENLINLQHYVIRERKVGEDESLLIFRNIIKTIRDIHEVRYPFHDQKIKGTIVHFSEKRCSSRFEVGKYCIARRDQGRNYNEFLSWNTSD